MEKKKLLLVSVSVGLFLVIVIGASILAFSPRNSSALTVNGVPASGASAANAPAASADTTRGSSFGRIDGAPPVPAAGTPPTGAPADMSLAASPAGTPPVPAQAGAQSGGNIIYINGENAESAVKIERTSDGNTKTYITIPSPQSPSSFEGDRARTPPPRNPPAGTEVASAPKTKAAAPAKAPASAPAAPAKAAAPKTTRNDYWIQVGSFTQKSRADDAKSYLSQTKGLGSIIVDSNINGKTVYRVRVGPYTSQSEANYWLSLIKEIDGMKDSLVWKSTATM
jgi:DedD protein